MTHEQLLAEVQAQSGLDEAQCERALKASLEVLGERLSRRRRRASDSGTRADQYAVNAAAGVRRQL